MTYISYKHLRYLTTICRKENTFLLYFRYGFCLWHQLYLWLLPFDLKATVLVAYVLHIVFVGYVCQKTLTLLLKVIYPKGLVLSRTGLV